MMMSLMSLMFLMSLINRKARRSAGFFVIVMNGVHLDMRLLIPMLLVFLVGCGTGSNSIESDSSELRIRDSLLRDSEMVAMNHASDIEWEKYDSIPAEKIELWRKERDDNNYDIELRYMQNGKSERLLITDSLPSYRYENPHAIHMELGQLNGVGREELLIRLGGFYNAATPDLSRGEEEDFFYVVNLDAGSLLWNGCSVSEAYQYCITKNDSICGEYEVGYDYKVHLKNGEVVLDSIRFLGDPRESKPDYPQGRYKWKNGHFVRTPN